MSPLRSLGRRIALEHRVRPREQSAIYLENIKDIFEAQRSSEGTCVSLDVEELTHADDYIRFAAFAFDLTHFSASGGDQFEVQWLTPKGIELYLKDIEAKVSFSKEAYEKIFNGKETPEFSLCTVLRNDENASRLYEDIVPLIESGRLFISPTRGIVTLDRTDDQGRRYWNVSDVTAGSPLELWKVDGPRVEPTILDVSQESISANSSLFDISYPFLAGIPFSDLAKVLDDEEYHISKARVGLKKILAEGHENGKHIPEIIDDLLRPELDALTRRYNSIASRYAIRQTAAVVGAATLALFSVSAGDISQAVAAVGSAGGIGLLAKETAERLSEQTALRENPHYLLWRLRNLKRKGA